MNEKEFANLEDGTEIYAGDAMEDGNLGIMIRDSKTVSGFRWKGNSAWYSYIGTYTPLHKKAIDADLSSQFLSHIFRAALNHI